MRRTWFVRMFTESGLNRWFINLRPKTVSHFEGASLVNRHANQLLSVIKSPEAVAVLLDSWFGVGLRHGKKPEGSRPGFFGRPFLQCGG